MLRVNIRTLFNHRRRLGLVDYGNHSSLSNADLDRLLREVLSLTPNAGETYITGSLRGRGIRVQRWRTRERLRILDPVGRAVRRRTVIRRRVYNVQFPNQLWYVDFGSCIMFMTYPAQLKNAFNSDLLSSFDIINIEIHAQFWISCQHSPEQDQVILYLST